MYCSIHSNNLLKLSVKLIDLKERKNKGKKISRPFLDHVLNNPLHSKSSFDVFRSLLVLRNKNVVDSRDSRDTDIIVHLGGQLAQDIFSKLYHF